MMSIINFRESGIEALNFIFKNNKTSKKIEKEIYEISLKNLRKNENIKTVYFLNILQITKDIQENTLKIKDISNFLKSEKMNWNHESISEIILEEKEQNEFIIKPFEIEEGVLECKCGSKRVYSYSKQCRGGDESSTTFATCLECKSKWTYSG